MSKRPRRKAMRRAYLKVYSQAYINTGKGPNAHALREYKERMDSVLQRLPKTLGLSPARLEVAERLKKLLEGIPEERNIVLWESASARVLLFFSADHATWVVVKLDKIKGLVLKSIKYPSKVSAINNFNNGRIVWDEKVRLDEGEPLVGVTFDTPPPHSLSS